MKIKTQFIVCLIVFTIVMSIIAVSVATTEQQIAYLDAQQEIAHTFEREANSLNGISIGYFLYQEDLQLSRWNTTLSSMSNDLANIKANSAIQQIRIDTVNSDLQELNAQFDDVVTYLQSAPRNVSVRIDPAFQLRWDTMAVQSQTLASDASQLSQSINDQASQINDTNILLILSLVGTFGAFLATIYLMVFRKTLKSVTKLQKGIDTIGTGNLDYTITVEGQNEITQLSHAFNQMTTNLKAVTASKTELEQAQASLRESEQRWATTLASIGDAVIATDLFGRVVFMNGVAEELTGWTLSEASNRSIKDVFNIINQQTRLEVESPVDRVLQIGLVVGLANHTILIRKDRSTEVPIDDSAAPIKDKDGKTMGVVLIFRDITERNKAEEAVKQRTEELQHTQEKLEENAVQLEEYASQMEELAEQRANQLKDAERLAAIGATAGMVGHDIRNPLQSITGDLYLAKTELAEIPDTPARKNVLESIEEIEKNVDYINKIVQDLQDYARPLNPKAEESDLKSIFEKLIAKNRPSNVKVKIEVAEEARKIATDSYYLNRILYNLVTNSFQAMPKGGKLTIQSYREANDTIITVKDTGVGIPKEIQSKMFTLMFTTKSKGQGFGLPVVKRMTEALGGTVSFESQEGEGTTFIVRLPSQKNL